ncbi:hypothetical protein GGE56_004413 [Rhizobium leguminosarum]|nr:hypothetical protein [Rhizobium leguminosarum]MBB6296102.1 hypothetical protein [Rhizobium leguminosarum]MDH6202903.1 hypothetical protein [Rhizobium leguminosarum]
MKARLLRPKWGPTVLHMVLATKRTVDSIGHPSTYSQIAQQSGT